MPEPQPGEALVRVEAVGICASDLKCYHGAAKFWGDENRPAWAETEVIPGHEFVGEGRRTRRRGRRPVGHRGGRPGGLRADRPVLEVPLLRARPVPHVQPHDIYGFKRRTPGAHGRLHGLSGRGAGAQDPADLPPAHAAFAEPLSCALHAVERASITFDDVVVVAGCGPIGLGMVAGAAAKYPAKVVALDMAPDKLKLAQECGADDDHQHRRGGRGCRFKDLTGGYGADVYLEGTGHPSAVAAGAEPACASWARYVEYSVFGSDVTVDWTSSATTRSSTSWAPTSARTAGPRRSG